MNTRTLTLSFHPARWLCLVLLPLAALGQDARRGAQVRVTTVPAGALISRNGQPLGEAPQSLADLRPGTHLIEASLAGYRDARRTVHVDGQERMAVELILEPVYGLVLVHSTPPEAEITVNGALRGVTPLLLTDLPLGSHRIELLRQGYQSRAVDLELSDRIPRRVAVDLVSDSAVLTIATTPDGAAVTVNGIERGLSPVTVERIPGGDATLVVSLEGYQPFRRTLRLAPGQTESLNVDLKPAPAQLNIVTLPRGARIYVDNQFRGESPLLLTNLPPATYRVRADLAGHDSMGRDVTLQRAASVVEEFRLQANSGRLEITTEPAGVRVLLNGRPVSVTEPGEDGSDRVSAVLAVEDVPVGNRTLLLTREGFHDDRTEVAIERAQTRTLHRRLERRFIPDCEVRTDTRVYRGVLVEVDPQGNVKLEYRPRAYLTIPAENIRSRRSIPEEP